MLGGLHARFVFARRVTVLADALARALPANARVLDVGCGDGSIDRMIMERRPDVTITGIDIMVRPETHIPVATFDGRTIPYADDSHDVVMFVDVLHHTEDPEVLLAEARRVASKAVVIKDHARDGLLAEPVLRLMDWVGNAPHGVELPYNYWPAARWRAAWDRLKLRVEQYEQRLGLYPWPIGLVFERSLHFIARLGVA